jgi:hypothetical protein
MSGMRRSLTMASKRASASSSSATAPGLGGGHLVAGAFQHRAQQVGDLGLVVDHQHAQRLGGASAAAAFTAAGGRRCAAPAAGSGGSRRPARGVFEHQVAAMVTRHRARHRQAQPGAHAFGPWW